MKASELYTEQIVSAVDPSTSGTSDPRDWFVRAINPIQSDSGIKVDGATALTSSVVFEATSIISGDIGYLPFVMHERTGPQSTREAVNMPGYQLMMVEPHSEILPSVFRETLQAWALLWGNGVAAIEFNGRREPQQLIPLEPQNLRVIRDEDGVLLYLYRVDGEEIPFIQNEVFHIRGLGGAIWGHSVIDLAQNSWGMNLGLQKHGNKHFANGAKPSGVLEAPIGSRMDPIARTELRKEWDDMHRGLDNAGKIALLPNGLQYKQLSLSNVDAQWVEGNEVSAVDVARWFKIPPHKIGVLKDSSVRANLEEQNRDYIDSCLNPWFVRWEQEAAKKLSPDRLWRSRRVFFKFNTKAKLKSNFKDRQEGYASQIEHGQLTINDYLALEDENGIGEEGDKRFRSNNMIPYDAPAATAVSQPREQPPNESAAAAIRDIVSEAASKACRMESERIIRGARQAANFTDWADKFYADFSETLAGYVRPGMVALRRVGVDTPDIYEISVAYCDVARDAVLAIAGQVKSQKALVESIKDYSAGWKTKTDELITSLVG